MSSYRPYVPVEKRPEFWFGIALGAAFGLSLGFAGGLLAEAAAHASRSKPALAVGGALRFELPTAPKPELTPPDFEAMRIVMTSALGRAKCKELGGEFHWEGGDAPMRCWTMKCKKKGPCLEDELLFEVDP